MKRFGVLVAVAVMSLLSLAGSAAAEQRWRDAVRLGPVREGIAMAAGGRGRVLIAWDAEDAIRWRFAHSGVTGRIETPAPGAPAAALDDRGGAVLAWGAFDDCKACTRGSVSFAARPPGRRAFKTSRRSATNVIDSPPTLALAASGRAA